MLLTRSPLTTKPKQCDPFDLHVLSTPPAFVLSQDQTLRKNKPTNHHTQQQPAESIHTHKEQTPAHTPNQGHEPRKNKPHPPHKNMRQT